MKHLAYVAVCIMVLPLAGATETIKFGNNSSEWAHDGECDDRRFRGSAMAEGLDRDDIGKDASDCRKGVNAGKLTVWDFAKAKAATQCSRINFGDDKSDYPNDGLCDDYRFDGPGADYVIMREDIGHDATDCRRLCDLGQIALRDY